MLASFDITEKEFDLALLGKNQIIIRPIHLFTCLLFLYHLLVILETLCQLAQWTNFRPLYVCLFFSKHLFRYRITVDLSRIRTQIVRIGGEQNDHLNTTTTAQLAKLLKTYFNRNVIINFFP